MNYESQDEFDKRFAARVEEALSNGMPSIDSHLNPIMGLALAHNEMFKTMQEAGFSSREALYITASIFQGNPGMPPEA